MKQSELRIGNYLQDAKGRLAPVEGLSKNNIKAYSGMVTEMPLKPIPLTEEWLLKFGFEKKPMYGKHNRYFFIKNKLYYCEHDFYSFVYSNNSLEIKEPKYVHQLQNLYFALTGEELTLKNK